jgi:DNA-binding transcriptional MerR regulator
MSTEMIPAVEAARRHGLHPETLRRWIRLGTIPPGAVEHTIGRRVFVDAAAVADAARRRPGPPPRHRRP